MEEIQQSQQVAQVIESIDGYGKLLEENIEGWESAVIVVICCLAVLVITLLATEGMRRLARGIFGKMKAHMPEELRVLLDAFGEPLLLLVRTWILFSAAMIMPLPFPRESVVRIGSTTVEAVSLLSIAWALWRSSKLCSLLLRDVQHRLDLETNRTVSQFFENIYRFAVALFSTLFILDAFGVPITSLIAGAGVVGLAVSLAAQPTISNLISGVTLVLEHPFGLGDYVKIENVEGTVENISFRSTSLRTPDNVLITVENEKVCNGFIHNLTNRQTRLWQFVIAVPFTTPRANIERLMADIRVLLTNDARIVSQTLLVVLTDIGVSGFEITVRTQANTTDYGEYLNMRSEMNLAIMDLMEKNGCKFAFPSTSVYMEKNTQN